MSADCKAEGEDNLRKGADGAGNILLVADSHLVQGSCECQEFMRMLDVISGYTGLDVAFLGDIMDLWIAKPRYEDEIQIGFCNWCLQEKDRRKIYFVEGNHEFFVARRHGASIGITSEGRIEAEGIVFAHGHDIQEGRLGFNRLFIRFCKSTFSSIALDFMPMGRRFAEWVKRRMGSRGDFNCRDYIPMDRVEKWAAGLARGGARDIFIGHFHMGAECIVGPNASCHVLAPWMGTGNVTLFNAASRKTHTGNWQAILQDLRR